MFEYGAGCEGEGIKFSITKMVFKKLKLRIRKLVPDAVIPSYNHNNDAGLDLYSKEDVLLAPQDRKMVGTGISIELPEDHAGLVWDRSGLAAKHGIKSMGGVIDEGYRGEIQVILYNTRKDYYQIKRGDRIAQLLIQKVEKPEIEIVDTLGETDRGEKGFGSSGK